MGDTRIVFAGTPDFAVPPLRALIDAGQPPVAVFTQPDRPAGRGRKVRPGPVCQLARDEGIAVHQPVTLRDAETRALLESLQPDLMIVVAYGLLLPPEVLALPTHGCWNIHASLLPRWRGAAPIQRAIEAGDDESGVCIMAMDAGLDTGPVLHSIATPILAEDTGGSLHDRLALLGAEALLATLHRLLEGNAPEPVSQDDRHATHAAKLSKAEAELDFGLPAAVLARRVRAFNPWPVAWTEQDGERLRIWAAAAIDGFADAPPGSLVRASAEGLDYATADGLLRVTELQRPGGRRMSVADYLNAHPVAPR